MEYKWITQQPNGFIKFHPTEPYIVDGESWSCERTAWKVPVHGMIGAPMICINLETHDYKVEDGVLMEVPKVTRCKYADIFIEAANDSSKVLQVKKLCTWFDVDVNSYEYRIKPVKKTIRFRNYLSTYGQVCTTCSEDIKDMGFFKQWIGDWQEVEV